MVSARLIFISITLVAAVASAQTPPTPNNGGRPFGGRGGADHGGPFTPGTGGNPAGPYTPGTSSGGDGNGPFTPGAGGAPAGPYTPGTIDAPTSGGPFSGTGGNGGFWGKVKNVGKSIWGGIVSVGNFLYTLGGLAPWAHMPAVGTLPMGGVGSNVGRNENTTPPLHGTPPNDAGPNVAGNAATRPLPPGRVGATFFTP